VDAFFSLPRGGAEIGGLLLGKHEGDRVSITAFEPLDCEHAMGPSFTLSPRDQALLAEMTAKAARNPGDRRAMGWYHSHTRSEIFLSETDQDIHKRFFPEPWQVALVLKPHTFEPTRGGFFFREADGSIRGSASYQEFVIDPLPIKPLERLGEGGPTHRPLHEDAPSKGAGIVVPEPAGAGDSMPGLLHGKEKARVPITREIPKVKGLGESASDQDHTAVAAPLAAPNFTRGVEVRSWRVLKIVACLAIGLAAGGVGYQTREDWLPAVIAKLRPLLPKEPEPYLSLSMSDHDGQLDIHWDRNSPAVRNALEATLQIEDGRSMPLAVRLDGPHLATGSFSYGRDSERVDVTLIAEEPGGGIVKEQTSFLGKLPGQKAMEESPDARKERDALTEKAEKLQDDYNKQAAKTRKLEKDLKDMRDQLESERKQQSSKKDQ
jgi:proteasome lid subunit RPN8/RPN11